MVVIRSLSHANRPIFRPFLLLGWTALLLLMLGKGTMAAEVQGVPSADILEAKIKEVESATDLDEATQSKLTELYRKALSNLETARSNAAAAEAFRQARVAAPEEAKSIRDWLEQAQREPPKVTLDVTEQTPLAELEQRLLAEKANLTAVGAKLAGLDEQLAVEAERPGVVRQRLTEAKQRQEELADGLKLPPPAGELPALTLAKRWASETHGLALSNEIDTLDQELLSQPMRVELLRAQRDRTARSVERLGELVQRLEDLLNERRRVEAEQAQAEAQTAQQEAAGKHPLVQRLAEENAALSEELKAQAAELERVGAEEDLAATEANRIEESFRTARQKLEIAGLSQALGQVLLKQRESLPDLRRFRKQAKAREALIGASGLRQIQHAEQRRALRDPTAYIATLTAGLAPEEVERLKPQLEELVISQRELLDKNIATAEAYLRDLAELDFTQRRLQDAAEAYDAFLAERLLWIRSTPPIRLTDLIEIPERVAALISPEGWLGVAKVLADQAGQSPALILTVLAVVILLRRRKALYSALEASGARVGRATIDRIGYSFQALALTLLLALPWPLLLGMLGWQLGQAVDGTDFTKAVAAAAAWVAPRLMFLRSIHLAALPHGLAAIHFGWPDNRLRALRRELRWFMPGFLAAAFITILALTLGTTTLGGAAGKLAFLTTLSILATFFYRALNPKRELLEGWIINHPGILLARLRYVWFPLLVAAPVAMAGLAMAGYVYTAGTLIARLIETLLLVVLLVLAQQLALRWLRLIRHRLAYQAAMERLEAARAEAGERETGIGGDDGLPLEVEETEVDLGSLSADTGKLLNTALAFGAAVGLWLIWSPVLPAFGILDGVSLWSYTAMADGQEQQIPVTLADLGMGLFIAAATYVAALRLPALLEIVLLQRMDMTSGGRYAVTTLSGYAIAAVGILLALNAIGASWSQVQWLVAALSVGIGFGLQEIVANFISGLIILFERPIRVGDYVTVGDSDGVVTRIRIRATTIQTKDRKELLVPNKEFITGRLLNWSLSDPTTRVVITVGVAYGSDVKAAMALMVEAAEQAEHVLRDPKPFTTFEGFGDNALTLILRCFIESVDHRLATISALHEEINRRFRDAGISIAFPQRDLHLDTSRPLDIRIRRNGPSESSG
jgi:potassium efflux system protein